MISVCVPYYSQPLMLRIHLDTWLTYKPEVRKVMKLIIVDDGSPRPAKDVIDGAYNGAAAGLVDLQLYRITKDIPWNRNGARNLGSTVAQTPWLLHMDIDHILPPAAAESLAARIHTLSEKFWYRFRRFRVGAADETRNKDAIPRNAKFGEIKPHIDSYLCSKKLYWKAGGYNEDFSGCLGGGSPFLRELEKVGGPPVVLGDNICLHVYTRDKCPDASAKLDRSRSEYKRRSIALTRAGKIKGHDPLRFPWERVP